MNRFAMFLVPALGFAVSACTSFTPEAAKAVAGTSLPVLGTLVDKSLLTKEDGRLRLHPLLQHLAAARLEDSTAREETPRAHALYFQRLMGQLRRGVEDGNRDALQAMDMEFQNCRAALQWAFTHEVREATARSMRTLLYFSDHTYRLDEGLSMLRLALEAPSVQADPGVHALLLASAAHLEYRLDRYADAQADATRALAATPADGDHETRLQCFTVLGGCGLRSGRLEDARHWFKQAIKQASASDPRSAAGALDNLALVEKSMGNYAESLRLCQQSLVQHRLLNDTAGEALCLNNLAAMYLDRGDPESARTPLREALALCERHGLLNTRAIILANLTELSVKTEDADGAERHARRAIEMAEASGQRALAGWVKTHTAELALRRGDLAAARAELAAALETAIAIGQPSLQFAGVTIFAQILAAQGAADCARRVLAFEAAHPKISAVERDKVRARLTAMGASEDDVHGWPGLELSDLVHRIVVECNVAHSPLIAQLLYVRDPA